MDYEQKIYYMNLYDYYHSLLTNKQQMYFCDYYFNDLSLAEISQKHAVTRAAIQDAIKKILIDLDYYEAKLLLYNKSNQRLAIYQQLDDSLMKDKLFALEGIIKNHEKHN